MNVHETEFVLGDEAKALGDGRFEGRLVTFGSEATPDKSAKRDWFDAKTDFGFEPGETITSPVFFHHGLDRKVGARRFGRGELEHRDDGIYIKGTISLKDDESRRLYQEIESGKHKLSSGVPSYLVDRKAVGDTHYVARWVLGSDASVTPTPADDRTYISSIKSLMDEQIEHEQGEAVPATLIDSLRTLVAGASELKARTAKAKADRGARGLASSYREAVEDLADALKAISDDWNDLAQPAAAVPPPVVTPDPPAPDPDEAAAAETAEQFTRFQLTLARLNGVAV